MSAKQTASRKHSVDRPLIERIEELKEKVNVLEGERMCLHESSVTTLQANRTKIANLRVQVHDLRNAYTMQLQKHAAIISQAFQNRPVEKKAFMAMTTNQALEDYDFRVSASMKRYNQAKYLTEMKRQKVQQLHQELQDTEKALVEDASENRRNRAQMQQIRHLENRVEKLQLKGNECEFIHKTYTAIFKRLSDEYNTCNHTLDLMEKDILRCRAEKVDLEESLKVAKETKEKSEEQVKEQERLNREESKLHHSESARLKRIMEEAKLLNLGVKKTSTPKSGGDTCTLSEDFTSMDTSELTDQPRSKKMLDSFENQIEKLRSVTGFYELKGIVAKFEDQLVVKNDLISLINNIERRVKQLQGDCSRSKDQLKLIEKKSQRVTQRVLSHESCTRINQSLHEHQAISGRQITEMMLLARIGLGQIVDKLTHMKLPEREKAAKPTTQEESLEDLLRVCTEKVKLFLSDLQQRDVKTFQQKMLIEENILLFDKDELAEKLKQNMPTKNKRVESRNETLLTQDGSPQFSESSNEYEDDNPLFKNREAMKFESSQFIEMRLKKPFKKAKNKKIN